MVVLDGADHREGGIESLDGCFVLLVEAVELIGGENRCVHNDLSGSSGRATQLRPGAECDAQRHPVGLTNAVQRWVGHLREALREESGDIGLDVGEGVDRITESHRRDPLGTGLQHRIHEVAKALLVEVIGGVALVIGEFGVPVP